MSNVLSSVLTSAGVAHIVIAAYTEDEIKSAVSLISSIDYKAVTMQAKDYFPIIVPFYEQHGIQKEEAEKRARRLNNNWYKLGLPAMFSLLPPGGIDQKAVVYLLSKIEPSVRNVSQHLDLSKGRA